MTVSQVLLLVGGILFFLASLAIAAAFLFLLWRIYRMADRLITAMSSLQGAALKMAEASRDIPTLEQGLIKVSQEIVRVLSELKESQEQFADSVRQLYSSLFAKDTQAYQDYDEKLAGRAGRVQELIQKGIDEAEANQRADQEMRDRSYSRHSLGIG